MANRKFEKVTNLVLVSILALGMISSTGCKRAPSAATPSAKPSTPATDPLPISETPGDNNNDGQSELPQEPTDTPEPLPAPTQPAQPGQTIIAKAIAKTTAYILPIGGVKGTYVTIELTWQPVTGAAEYWLYKGALPTKEQAAKGSAYKVVKANGIVSTLFIDGVQPPSFSGGNLWDKIKQGVSAVTLKPGNEYKYKVFAADLDGNVIGESDAAITIPLPPIASPANIKVSDTSKVLPLFEWELTNGVAPDGFYVSVYPPIAFGKQSFTSTNKGFGLAYWSTFRAVTSKVARYGTESDNAAAYPGTMPFDITFPLRMGNKYSVSVTAVKTDSNDMRTAKAISRAWSDSKIFAIGADATAPVTPAPSVAPASDSSSSSSSTSIVDKIKSIFGF